MICRGVWSGLLDTGRWLLVLEFRMQGQEQGQWPVAKAMMP